MPLTRADGFPTHHLRVVAMWRDMMLAEQGSDLIHLSGDEWKAHVIHAEELLTELEPELRVLPSLHIVHGMVSSEVDGELSSSKGTAQLVDELLDELAARPEVRALARDGEPLLSADDLVAIAVLGYCLDKPVHKGLVMPSVDHFLDPDHNTGWRIALAWAKAWDVGQRRRARPGPGRPGLPPHRAAVAGPPPQPRGRAGGPRPAEVRALCRPPQRLVSRRRVTTRAWGA